MAKKSKMFLEIPVNWSGSCEIPEDLTKIVDADIKRGELHISLELYQEANGNGFSFSLYPDKVDGDLVFSRTDLVLHAKCNFVYMMPITEFEQEHIALPAKLKIDSINTTDCNYFYLNEDADGNFGVIVESDMRKIGW